jgi:cyclohexa-1,5-dienecarbonyl-CoA hydratase
LSPIRSETIHNGQVERWHLTLPHGNILDEAVIQALHKAAVGLKNRQDVKVIVLSSESDDFASEAVPEHVPAQVAKLLPSYHALFRAIDSLGIPTAAIVRGKCIGGGCELAMSCGWVFCDKTAEFSVPQTKAGVFPPIASVLLPWRVGGARATQLILTGRTVSAEEAERIGLADRLVSDPEGELTFWLGREILPKSALTLRFAWQNARRPIHRQLVDRLMELETSYLGELMAHHDPQEGLRAAAEGRRPDWKND